MNIYTIDNKDENKFLRQDASEFNFDKFSRKEIDELIKKMRSKMKELDGIGLSANQIGLDYKVFVAQVDDKFYAIFNPKITKLSETTEEMEEGCLSVPNRFGPVSRPDKITLEGWDKNGRKIKIKAWGFLARVFQHEVDHLEGQLFVDHAKEIYEIKSAEKNKL